MNTQILNSPRSPWPPGLLGHLVVLAFWGSLALLGGCAENGEEDPQPEPNPSDLAYCEQLPELPPGEFQDIQPGGASLQGTLLSGVSDGWTQPLVLCSAPVEGQTLDDAFANKVRVTVPPTNRTSLANGELAESSIDGELLVETGPMSDQSASGSVSTSRLASWSLQELDGGHAVDAALVHELEGGSLVEIWHAEAGSNDGATAPLVEHRFTWHGVDGRVARLVECPKAEDADQLDVNWMHDNDAIGRQLARWQAPGDSCVDRTTVLAEAGVGYNSALIQDFWAIATRIDNGRETGLALDIHKTRKGYFQEVLAYENGNRTEGFSVARIKVDGESTAFETFDFGTGEFTTVPALATEWAAAEPAAFQSALDERCPDDGEILTLGQGYLGQPPEYVFHLLTCPDASTSTRRSITGIVAARFAAEPEQSGTLQTALSPAEVMISGDPVRGVSAVFGEHTLSMGMRNGDEGMLDVFWSLRKGDGSEIYAAVDQPSEFSPPTSEGALETLIFDGAGDLHLEIDRLWVAQGAGHTGIYAPVEMRLTGGAQNFDVEIHHWDMLEYENTHHNWDDGLIATAGNDADDLVVTWDAEYDLLDGTGQHFYLNVKTVSGDVVLEQVEVEREWD